MNLDVATQTVGAFGAFMPAGVVTMRHFDPSNPTKRDDVRLGMTLALVWSFVIAAAHASKEGNGKPYLWWLVMAAAMLTLYEFAFRIAPPGDSNGDS